MKVKARGLPQSKCKECHNAYAKDHHQRTKDKHNAQVSANNLRYQAESLDTIVEKLIDNPCVRCGETNILCLEFHHLDRDTKKNHVSALKKFGRHTLQKEIDKCVVMCANCHRIVTHEEQNSRRWQVYQNMSR